MNERTEALAKQAAEYAIEFAAKDQELYIPRLMEKFAELIVKECMKELEASKRCDPYTGDLFDCEYNTCLNNQIKVLIDHFGVEE
jgi:hypothetical protein